MDTLHCLKSIGVDGLTVEATFKYLDFNNLQKQYNLYFLIQKWYCQ